VATAWSWALPVRGYKKCSGLQSKERAL